MEKKVDVLLEQLERKFGDVKAILEKMHVNCSSCDKCTGAMFGDDACDRCKGAMYG